MVSFPVGANDPPQRLAAAPRPGNEDAAVRLLVSSCVPNHASTRHDYCFPLEHRSACLDEPTMNYRPLRMRPRPSAGRCARPGILRLLRRSTAVALVGLLASLGTSVAAPASPTRLRVLPADRDAPISYVALGDSTVEGVGASAPTYNYVSRIHERLRQLYPRARLANLGESGATAADVRDRQLAQAVSRRPDLVTLSVGPNDITRQRSLGDYRRDVEAILRMLTANTSAVIVVNLIPDMSVTPRFRGKELEPLIRRRVIAFNEALGRQARAYRAQVVDLYRPSQEEVPRRPELVAADRYHPSDEGYARWADLMWSGIEARRRR